MGTGSARLLAGTGGVAERAEVSGRESRPAEELVDRRTGTYEAQEGVWPAVLYAPQSWALAVGAGRWGGTVGAFFGGPPTQRGSPKQSWKHGACWGRDGKCLRRGPRWPCDGAVCQLALGNALNCAEMRCNAPSACGWPDDIGRPISCGGAADSAIRDRGRFRARGRGAVPCAQSFPTLSPSAQTAFASLQAQLPYHCYLAMAKTGKLPYAVSRHGSNQHQAIISVYDKTGLLDLAKGLIRQNVRLLASGGTARMIRESGFTVEYIYDCTGLVGAKY